MTELPNVTARFAPQPPAVAWPTEQWPRGTHARHDQLEVVVDELFSDADLAITNAVVVVQGGRVLIERYAGVQEYFDRPAEPVTSESALLSWSMAKSVLHMIIGTLVDDGQLHPQRRAPVAEWQLANDPRHQIRLCDLLAMRDGLDFVEVYESASRSDVIDMLFGDGRADMAAFTAARPLAHAPDSFFNYSSGTTNLLSRIVAEHVGFGEEYASYLRERLLGPIGMTSAVATFDASGVWTASSYLHARALDFARFGLLYLRGGQWDGRQLISRAWTETAQRPLSLDEGSGDFYAWQWWVTGDEYGTYWASGYEGQMICIVPALDALILRFGHTPEANYPALKQWRRRLLAVLAAAN